MTDSKVKEDASLCRRFNTILQTPGKKICTMCFHHGKLVARYPKTIILLCFLLAASLGVGCCFVKLDKDVIVDDVYFPQETSIALDRKRFNQMFSRQSLLDREDNDVTSYYFYPHQSVGRPPGFALIIISENNKLATSPINLNQEAVELFKQICQQVRNFSSVEISGQAIAFEDVCQVQPDGSCYEPDLCDFDLAEPNLNSLTTEFMFHNFKTNQNGLNAQFSFKAVRLVWFFKSHRSTEVSIFTRKLFDFLNNKYCTRKVFFSSSSQSEVVNSFNQSQFNNSIDQSETAKPSNQSKLSSTTSVLLSFYFYANSERLHELRSQISSSIVLFLATVFVMISFAVSTSCSLNETARWEFTLVLCGVLTVLLTVVSSVGVMACFSVPFLTVSHIIPFLLLGIGIDSAFILINEWNQQLCNWDSNHLFHFRQGQLPDVINSAQIPSNCNSNQGELAEFQGPNNSTNDNSSTDRKVVQKRTEEVVGGTMQHGFLSIIVSNLTAFVTFSIGAFTIFPVINYTCYYLACSLGFLLWHECTFFPACLALYTGRQHPQGTISVEVSPNSKTQRATIREGRGVRLRGRNTWHKVTSNGLATLMGSRRVNLLCIFFGILFAFLGMMKCYVTDEFADDSTYLPDSSKTRLFLEMNDRYFSNRFLIQVMIDTPMKIQSEIEMRSAIESVNDTLINLTTSRCIEKTNLPINWVSIVDKIPRRFLNLETTNIRETLEFFLRMGANSKKLSFVGLVYNDLKLDNNNTLISSRVYVISRKYNSTAEAEKCVKSLYDISAESTLKLRFCSFELSQWDRNMNMKTYIWRSLLLAVICCSVIVSLFLGKLLVVFGVILTVLLSMLAILGSMALVGMRFDFLAYITVLLSIGLCIDYMAHSGHYYLSSLRLQQCIANDSTSSNDAIKIMSLNGQLIEPSKMKSSNEKNKMKSLNGSIKMTPSNGAAKMTQQADANITLSIEHLQITSSPNGTSNNITSSSDGKWKIESSNDSNRMTSQIASVESVWRMASPLTNAAVSSVIGVILLHFSDSPPLRFISHSLAIMFVLSFFYSVLFLPSLFRFLDFENNMHSRSNQNDQSFSLTKTTEINGIGNKLQTT